MGRNEELPKDKGGKGIIVMTGLGGEGGGRTEDKLLRRREHVEGEGDFVLVAFALEPVEEGGGVDHCGEERYGEDAGLLGFNGLLEVVGGFWESKVFMNASFEASRKKRATLAR